MIEKLQYITQETATLSHIDCVREACIYGVKWIQLRIKGCTLDAYLEIAKEAKIICDLYDVVLIVNDNVEVAQQVNAHGVHLGKADMPIAEARSILGEHTIIGGTANTIEDVERLMEEGFNYIGLGPMRFTETKKQLSPMLGYEGYEEIWNEIKTNYPENKTPIIAIGGITMEDLDTLLRFGVYGFAVSGLLTNNFSNTGALLKAIERKVFKIDALSKQ